LTYERTLRGELSFGDVCEAEFLYDAHVRADARAMGADVAPAAFAKKRWGIDADVAFFIPGVGIGGDRHYVLAHGVHQGAVLLSDDCHIASALGRDTGEPTNRRLLFAPVVEGSEEEVAELEEANFGRFPLPADDRFDSHGVVDIRRCFMVDARDVHAALTAGGFRVRSLSDEARADLAIRWSAYAVRRGPFVAEDSLEKFAEYLLDARHVHDESDALDVAGKLVDVVAAAWGYEGRAVEDAGNAAEDRRPPRDVIDELVRELELIRDRTGDALAALGDLP
jgi:hypothetical protein